VLTLAAGRGRIFGGVLDMVHRRPSRQAQGIEELLSADRRKDEFLAMLGHELRNPLGVIRNAVGHLQLEPGVTPAGQRTQALIERQVRRMTQLVEDLFDVSRIRTGQLHLQRERIDLRAIVRNALEALEPDVSARRQQLITALPLSPVWLQGDPWRLEQVFVNLLGNASRYTDAEGEVCVSMHVRDGEVVVRIRDSGIGIAPDALPYIFDLFRQADAAVSRSHAGLGIGLALARSFVALHGGCVTATSAGLGRGSEFTVLLPREAGSPEEAAADDHFPS